MSKDNNPTTSHLPEPSKCNPDDIRAYKSISGQELRAHIFSPENLNKSEKLPVFVFFHPGGWSMGGPEWGYDICCHYSRLGMVTISFQYRLSSIGGYSPLDAVWDARSALRWTRQEAAELGIDPNRLVAGGISAGAHLAACAAMIPGMDDPQDNLAFSPVPQALALQSACVNPVIESHFVELLQNREKPEKLSPAHHVRAGLPPMCLFHGTADEIVPYHTVKEFTEKMRGAGNRCDLHSFEGVDHFFMDGSAQARVPGLIESFLKSLGYC
ncbi:MAG: alpha/beta hydrolase [Deltaproteobacteria bacterium]|nr:alpha/beta hydrolase [Deltaproteobacteria bacterium]